jgi:hypothetical protein
LIVVSILSGSSSATLILISSCYHRIAPSLLELNTLEHSVEGRLQEDFLRRGNNKANEQNKQTTQTTENELNKTNDLKQTKQTNQQRPNKGNNKPFKMDYYSSGCKNFFGEEETTRLRAHQTTNPKQPNIQTT